MANDSASALIKCALNCRCPVCRNGAIFQSHFKMNRECPRCHVVFWKDPGETLGAMYLDFAVAAASFLIVWAILALTTMLIATHFKARVAWISGAVLMVVVVLKLFLVDLSSIGSIERIVSFVGVGLLMLVIGYFSPLPPAAQEAQ